MRLTLAGPGLLALVYIHVYIHVGTDRNIHTVYELNFHYQRLTSCFKMCVSDLVMYMYVSYVWVCVVVCVFVVVCVCACAGG